MKKILLGALLLLSTLGFSQTYSGTVYLKHEYTGSIMKYSQGSGQTGLITVQDYNITNCNTNGYLYWRPIGSSATMNGSNNVSKLDLQDLLFQLGVFDTCNPYDWSSISTDPLNPTIIPISPNSDLLYSLNLGSTPVSPHTYTPSSAGVTLYFTVVNTLNINQNTLTELSLYPNPTNGDLYLSTNTDKNIKIYDMIGNKLIDKNINNLLDISNLSNGIYLCEITEDGNKLIKRIIKK